MYTNYVSYEEQGVPLEGFIAYDDATQQKRPGVILCHAWRGRDNFICEQAVELAKWGYAAFALDMYGKGVFGNTRDENQALMEPFIKDRMLLQRRLLAALNTFQKKPIVDSTRIASLGFCFGGLCSLDFARSGANLKGCISMHGLLNAPKHMKAQPIKAKILALHGNDDPLVPPEVVAEFENEMTTAGADWQIHIYGHTMHAFTNPLANDPDFGTVYNPVAAKRAWQSVRNFLAECLSDSK